MKKRIMMIGVASALVMLTGCKKDGATDAAPVDVELDSLDKKVSYIFGYDIARKTKSVGFELDTQAMVQAIQDAREDKDPRLSDEEMQATMVAFQTESQAKRREQMKQMADENLQKGKDFLVENGKREGVTTTESGLQYEALQSGDGASPTKDDKVKVHYRGTLLDGTEFDSSLNRDPAVFKVAHLIPGWVEALPLMKVGDKWKLFIPSELGYGAGGTQRIPPNSTLVFEMELLDIVKEEQKPAEAAK